MSENLNALRAESLRMLYDIAGWNLVEQAKILAEVLKKHDGDDSTPWDGIDDGDDDEDDIDFVNDPPIEPVYPIETVLLALTGSEAIAAIREIIAIWNGVSPAIGKFDDIIQSLEEYFGGEPDKIFLNDDGDLIMMSGDKKIRFDLEDPHGEDPHFHVEKLNENGEWIDAGEQHMHPFKKE
jgi:hypothetical protein